MMRWIAPVARRLPLIYRLAAAARLRPASGSGSPAPSAPPSGEDGAMRRGDLVAERVALAIGSWLFLGVQAGFLALWVTGNGIAAIVHAPAPDYPPYILLNLMLSFQAAFTGPVLLIAANAAAVRDKRAQDLSRALAARTEQLAEAIQRQEAQELTALAALSAQLADADARAERLEALLTALSSAPARAADDADAGDGATPVVAAPPAPTPAPKPAPAPAPAAG